MVSGGGRLVREKFGIVLSERPHPLFRAGRPTALTMAETTRRRAAIRDRFVSAGRSAWQGQLIGDAHVSSRPTSRRHVCGNFPMPEHLQAGGRSGAGIDSYSPFHPRRTYPPARVRRSLGARTPGRPPIPAWEEVISRPSCVSRFSASSSRLDSLDSFRRATRSVYAMELGCRLAPPIGRDLVSGSPGRSSRSTRNAAHGRGRASRRDSRSRSLPQPAGRVSARP